MRCGNGSTIIEYAPRNGSTGGVRRLRQEPTDLVVDTSRGGRHPYPAYCETGPSTHALDATPVRTARKEGR